MSKLILKSLIGKTKEEALNLLKGKNVRVVPFGFMITLDYIQGRITLFLGKDGKIVKANMG